MNVLNLDNKSPSQALLISQLILVIRTVTPTKEQILYCCLILSISALFKINIRLYRQVDFLLNRFTKDHKSFPKNGEYSAFVLLHYQHGRCLSNWL